MTRFLTILFLLFSLPALFAGCATKSAAEPPLPRVSIDEQRFDKILAKYPDWTFQQLAAATPKRDFLKQLSFDPAQAKFYEETIERLKLTDAEKQMLTRQGFVSVDHDQRYSFGSLYFAVYSDDLPVLITTDSILHAMHRTYDDIFMEIEQTFLTAALDEVLEKCHDTLASFAPSWGTVAKNYRDVDLYLTVARNLLRGAGAPLVSKPSRYNDEWGGNLLVNSKLGQDDDAIEILKLITSLKLQSPQRGKLTSIYGGQRPIDYSQFKPRGHYTKSIPLSRYFRAMMWLGRADTAWNVLPPDRESGIVSDSPRELRDAALLTSLLQSTGAVERLKQINGILELMVGESDNLTVPQMLELLAGQKISNINDLTSSRNVEAFQDELRKGEGGTQQIRSQVILSDPKDLYQVSPPSTFQLFGQRFAVDSFVLSKVVFDSIIYDGKKVERHMPTGADVMVALGNDAALPLLRPEMESLPYASNLQASRQFLSQFQPSYWQRNLYNIWLDALRPLSADRSSEKNFPEAMRTEAWQMKQLQTQLASWSELRHNTVLYAKQSSTAEASCEYPTGYVEPYPETYARIKFFADEAARRISAADYHLSNLDFTDRQKHQVEFLQQMAKILRRLEVLARKELAAEPFTNEDRDWLKQTIDIRRRFSGSPTYTGWYCQLFYGGGRAAAEWDPTIVDVHTDPNSQSVLEEAVGSCNFLIAAIGNETDHMIYVGPAYSYYEFRQPAADRLTDERWVAQLASKKEPTRPTWTSAFQAPKLQRDAGK
jgi:hypothetical protein